MYTRHDKDMLDIQALKDKVDERKIEETKKYETTLQVVEATLDGAITQTDVLSSAIKATEETTRTGTINQQANEIKRTKTREEIKNVPNIE